MIHKLGSAGSVTTAIEVGEHTIHDVVFPNVGMAVETRIVTDDVTVSTRPDTYTKPVSIKA